jgi:hypothetical protein
MSLTLRSRGTSTPLSRLSDSIKLASTRAHSIGSRGVIDLVRCGLWFVHVHSNWRQYNCNRQWSRSKPAGTTVFHRYYNLDWSAESCRDRNQNRLHGISGRDPRAVLLLNLLAPK